MYFGTSMLIYRRAQGGNLKETTPEEKETARIYRRFYLALQLRDICNEMPVHMVSRKYDVPRGAVQTLGQTCQGFAAGSEYNFGLEVIYDTPKVVLVLTLSGIVIKFCEQMNWGYV